MPVRKLVLLAVFLLSLARFTLNVSSAGLADGYIDPVGRIVPQDEAVYAHTSLRMARQGDWLTPHYLERFAFYKPPLLYWLSGASVKAAGPTRFSIRLPSLLASAAAATLVFAWALHAAGWLGACAALLLLWSNPLWHVLSRLALTDALLGCWIVAALYCLGKDPGLERRASAAAFGIFSGLAVLTKALAGLLPLLVLAVFRLLAPRGSRAPWHRLLLCLGAAALVVLPWHLYQLAAHPRWFLAEYVGVEMLGYTIGAPPQTTVENHIWFYVRRMLLTDPVICFAALAALPAFFVALRRRNQPLAVLLAAWMGVTVVVVLANSYRNFAYLLPLLPALALLFGAYAPLRGRRARLVPVVCLATLFLVKSSFPGKLWGIPYEPAVRVPSAALLADYCRMQRQTELLLVDPDDEFLSSALPLARVRYVFAEPPAPPRPLPLDFRTLGIMLRAEQFANLERERPVYAARLRQWGLPNDGAIATAITYRSAEDLAVIVEARPEADFLVPNRHNGALAERLARSHRPGASSPERRLWLARSDNAVARQTSPAPAGCGI